MFPDYFENMTVNQMADAMIKDIVGKIDDTGIFSGVIGEIETG
jgi:predicted metal-dependent phosphotriesterase family hydrolase